MTATFPTPTRETIAIVPFGHILVAELSIAELVILRVTDISSIHSSCMSDDEIQPIFPFQYDDISFEGVPPPQNEAIFLSAAFSQDALRFLRKTNSCSPLLYLLCHAVRHYRRSYRYNDAMQMNGNTTQKSSCLHFLWLENRDRAAKRSLRLNKHNDL